MKSKKVLKKRRAVARKAGTKKVEHSSWHNVGAMRIALALMTMMLIVFSVEPGTPGVFEGGAIWRTVIFPVLAPILLQVLLLDALMARIFMVDRSGDAYLHYRRILLMDLFLSAALTLWWLPYFLALFSPR